MCSRGACTFLRSENKADYNEHSGGPTHRFPSLRFARAPFLLLSALSLRIKLAVRVPSRQVGRNGDPCHRSRGLNTSRITAEARAPADRSRGVSTRQHGHRSRTSKGTQVDNIHCFSSACSEQNAVPARIAGESGPSGLCSITAQGARDSARLSPLRLPRFDALPTLLRLRLQLCLLLLPPCLSSSLLLLLLSLEDTNARRCSFCNQYSIVGLRARWHASQREVGIAIQTLSGKSHHSLRLPVLFLLLGAGVIAARASALIVVLTPSSWALPAPRAVSVTILSIRS